MRFVRFFLLMAVCVAYARPAVPQPAPRTFGLQGLTVRDIAVSPGYLTGMRRYLYAVTDGNGVFRRDLGDPSSDWEPLGLEGVQLRSVGIFRWGVGPFDFEIPLVGARSGDPAAPLLYAYTDSGWVPADSGIDRGSSHEVRAIAGFTSTGHRPPAPVFAAVDGRVYTTASLAFYWEQVLDMGLGAVNALCVSDVYQQCGFVWAGGENAIFAPWIARSPDCGLTWHVEYPNLAGDNACDALAVHRDSQHRVFAGMEGAVIVSEDSGKTWRPTSLRDQPVYFFGIAVDPRDPQHVWAGGAASPDNWAALWESFDAGRTWLAVWPPSRTQVAGIAKIVADPISPGTVYIATLGDGVWVYRNEWNWDALILALRLQVEGVHLDTALAQEIASALALARTVNDSLAELHAFPDYVPTELLVSSDQPWTYRWRQGWIWTGYEPVDSLGREFGLESVEEIGEALYLLRFAEPLRIPALAELYERVPGVQQASPNRVEGDGDRIEGFKKGGNWYFAFSHGWGDCPSGCIHRKYWYVVVHGGGKAEPVRVWQRDFSVPRVYLWNIPARFPATVFQNVDELLAAFRASEWWVRRHAVVVCGLLFERSEPWVPEDEPFRQTFDALRDGVRSRRTEVLAALQSLVADPDRDVRQAALEAINRALGYSASSYGVYFPLRVGNEWQFARSEPWTVTDSVVVDSLSYFHLSQFPPFGPCLVRLSPDGRLFVRDQGDEQLWLDFSAEVGDRWPVTDRRGHQLWTVELQSKTDTLKVPAGHFFGCYRFWFHFRGADNDWVLWFAPGVGPVRVLLLGFAVIDMPLEAATVQGVQYPTAVREGPAPPREPVRFELMPPFPNPTAGMVRLNLTNSGAGPIEVAILDVRGRVVREWRVDGSASSTLALQWDGRDGSGAPLPSGVYLVRARSGTHIAFRKLLLMR